MAPGRPTNSGRGNQGPDRPRRGRPSHGQEKAAPIIPAQNQRALELAIRQRKDRQQAKAAEQQEESLDNDDDSTMTGVEVPDPQPGPQRGGTRASRGGFGGRGRGGRFSGPGRAHHNNYQTARRSGTSSSYMVDECLPTATASEMIWVANSSGQKSAKAINRTPGGGNSHAFAQQRPNHERWGITPGYGLDEEARDLLKKSKKSHVIWQMIAVDDETFERVSKTAVEKTIEDHNGKNVEGKNALLLRGWVDPQPKEEEEEDEEKCKVCGNPDHTVSTCFSHTRQGETFGCPRCDTADHSGSDCAEIAKLSLTEQVKILITNRGNMPAYHEGPNKQSWWKLLHRFCMSAEYDQELLPALPWGKGYPRKLRHSGEDVRELQKKYDDKTGVVLPSDPSTATLVRVAQKWDSGNLPWPKENLGDRPRHQDGDQRMEDAAPAAEPQQEGPEAAAPATTTTVAEPAPGPAPPAATTTVAEPPTGSVSAATTTVAEPPTGSVSAATTTVAEPATGSVSASAPATTDRVLRPGPAEDEVVSSDEDDDESVGKKSSDEDLIDYSDDE